MADSPLNAKAGLSVGDFKAGINEINRSMRVLSSEFKASAATLGDWSKDATGLESRISFLNKSIDLQKQKVEALKGQMEAEARAGKETAASKAEMTVKINKATEELNKMQRELGEDEKSLADVKQGSDEAGKSVKDLGENSQEAASGMDTMRSMAGGLFTALKVGLGTVLALVGAVVALTGAIGGLVFSTAKSADELNDLSLKTGITTTRLQELAYAGEQIGTSSETMTSSFSKLTRSMGSASDQFADYANKVGDAKAKGKEYDGTLGEQADAFDALGVNIVDASGKFRTSEAVFTDVINALGKVEDPTLRDMYAMSLLGKSAMELNPLIKAGSGELARLSEEAHKVGAVMSEDDVQAFAEFNDQLSGLKMGLQGTLGTLGGAFLPGFKAVFSQAGGYLREFAGIVKGSDGDIGKIATGMTGLVKKIISDLAAQGPQYLQGGLTILQGLINAILQSLPGMLPIALQIIQSLLAFFIGAMPQIMDAGVQILLMLINGLVSGLPGLVTAAVQMILTLLNGLTAAMPQLIPVIAQVIPLVVQILLQNLPLIIQAAVMLILALLQGLQQASPQLYAAMPELVKALMDALIAIAPILSQAGIELIKMIGQGMVTGVPNLLSAIGGIVEEIFAGLYRGFQNNMPKFLDQIKKFFGDIVKAAKQALGISSPSSVFDNEVGTNIPPGIGRGITRSMPALERQLATAMRGMAHNFDAGAEFGFGGSGRLAFAGAGASISVGDIYVDARGASNPKAVGEASKDGVLSALRAKGAA